MNQRMPGPNASIDLNRPGIRMNNVIFAANFHTRPLQAGSGVILSHPELTWQTHTLTCEYGEPQGISWAHPPTCSPSSDWGETQPPPWAVSNQWPEGTGARAADGALAENEATTDDDSAGGSNVICVEWSDEDFVYDEPLVESEIQLRFVVRRTSSKFRGL
ncbi:hypothetical protein ARMGADRAFT_1088428 [Armillaria gallica]|uniref:Uncharacterized protein n=1 Tax=Armillaria gallica TaxID=47427 RepID=A0A2H3CRA6_ARMGA|nr:hypothetical protein ARMGADRAFT_1088428 [Armillaria gallica]